jgi:hypothetical protein
MAPLFTKNRATDTAQQARATSANAKDVVQDILARARKTAQSTFKTTKKATQDTRAKVQDSKKAQNLLRAGVSIASAIGALLYENQRKAQKKLKQAQNRLKRTQTSLAKTTTPIVEKTQDVITTSKKKASSSLQKAAGNTKEAKESLQDWYAQYQRKRQRNRVLFRIGLLAGVALALFYTPLTGADVRQRIAEQWQRYRPYFER